MELIDNATQSSSSNLTAEQLDAVKQLRIEGELLNYYTIIINSEDQ
jgi:hypothetical protein